MEETLKTCLFMNQHAREEFLEAFPIVFPRCRISEDLFEKLGSNYNNLLGLL